METVAEGNSQLSMSIFEDKPIHVMQYTFLIKLNVY